MSFKTIIGQPLAVELAQRWLAQKTNHSLLLYGPEGAGKRAVALEIAKALNCSEKTGQAGCDRCLSCRKIASGKHPDVRVLDLAYQALDRDEPLEKQQSLRIELILDERRRLYETAVEGPWKVSILDDADKLTPDAANVLLKVLEEPPADTAIILITPHRDRLFATLVSRCQPLRFRLRAKAATPGVSEETDELWKTLPNKTPAEILAGSPSRGKSAALDRVRVQENLDSLLEPAVRSLRAGDLAAAAWVELIHSAQQQLRRNVQPSLVYDHLLLKLSAIRRAS